MLGSTDASCCNFGNGSRCSNGTCALPPPVVIYSQATFVREYELERDGAPLRIAGGARALANQLERLAKEET